MSENRKAIHRPEKIAEFEALGIRDAFKGWVVTLPVPGPVPETIVAVHYTPGVRRAILTLSCGHSIKRLVPTGGRVFCPLCRATRRG